MKKQIVQKDEMPKLHHQCMRATIRTVILVLTQRCSITPTLIKIVTSIFFRKLYSTLSFKGFISNMRPVGSCIYLFRRHSFLLIYLFIFIQLQLSVFSPHPSTPPQPLWSSNTFVNSVGVHPPSLHFYFLNVY